MNIHFSGIEIDRACHIRVPNKSRDEGQRGVISWLNITLTGDDRTLSPTCAKGTCGDRFVLAYDEKHGLAARFFDQDPNAYPLEAATAKPLLEKIQQGGDDVQVNVEPGPMETMANKAIAFLLGQASD